MSKRINPIASAIASLNDAIKRSRESQAMLKSKAKLVNGLCRRVTGSKRFVPLSPTVWVSQSDDWNDERKAYEHIINVGISISNLPGFKDKRFIDLLSKFLDADKESTRDYAASLNRDFFFWFRQPEANTWIKVSVYAYVRSDSPTCRKVLQRVETEVIEKPVYEIVCD